MNFLVPKATITRCREHAWYLSIWLSYSTFWQRFLDRCLSSDQLVKNVVLLTWLTFCAFARLPNLRTLSNVFWIVLFSDARPSLG